MKRVCAALVVLFFSTVSTMAQEEAAVAGSVTKLAGQVSLLPAGSTVWVLASQGLEVEQGDRIKTEAGASCEITLEDGTFVIVNEKTETEMEELNFEPKTESIFATVKLWAGGILGNIAKLKQKSRMAVKTPVATVAVRGTEFSVEQEGDATHIALFEGELRVRDIATQATQERGLPTDSQFLMMDLLMEMGMTRDQQTTIKKGAGVSKPAPLAGRFLEHRRRMVQFRARAETLRQQIRQTPREQRWRAPREMREKLRTELSQRHGQRMEGIRERIREMREKGPPGEKRPEQQRPGERRPGDNLKPPLHDKGMKENKEMKERGRQPSGPQDSQKHQKEGMEKRQREMGERQQREMRERQQKQGSQPNQPIPSRPPIPPSPPPY